MGADNTEVELKLTVDRPGEFDRVRAAPALAGITGGPRRDLDSVYYDTADMSLYRRGVALRVRRVGNRFVQTVKTDGAGGSGVQRRGEWEAPVGSFEPELDAIDDAEARAHIGPLGPGELRPVFTTRIERETRLVDSGGVEEPGRVVEVALDRGVITADGRELPVAEVELELLRGTPASLYRLALELHHSTPLRLQSQSKAARGYALALGLAPMARRGQRLELDGDASVDEAVAAVARACLDHWTANEAAAADGRDPEGVHQTRVGLRRLRSAMSVFRDVVPDAQRQWIDAEAEQVLAALGPARDLDVFIAETVAPVAKAHPGDARLEALVEAAEAARKRAYLGVAEALAAPRYTSFVLRLGLWLEERAWREGGKADAGELLQRPLMVLAEHLLAKRHQTVITRGRKFETLSAARRHRVRIAVKKLRYATEFFAGLYAGGRRKRYLRALAELQDRLGRVNDIATARSVLERLAGESADADRAAALPEAGTMVLDWHARWLADHDPDLVRAWREFAARKPFWHKAK